jgi:hypothetical protein
MLVNIIILGKHHFWDKYETIVMLTNICSGKPREMWENRNVVNR